MIKHFRLWYFFFVVIYKARCCFWWGLVKRKTLQDPVCWCGLLQVHSYYSTKRGLIVGAVRAHFVTYLQERKRPLKWSLEATQCYLVALKAFEKVLGVLTLSHPSHMNLNTSL
jgi:hypothetical protein